MTEESYSLKEVIEKNFLDLKNGMAVGFSEIKVDIKEIRDAANEAKTRSKSNTHRLNRYDKHILVIYAAIVGGIIKLVFDYL